MLERLVAGIILAEGWRRALIACLAGALLVLGLPPFGFPAVGFLSFPILVLLLDGAAGAPGAGAIRRLLPAFRIGWCFGLGYFVGGLWWLGTAMTVEGDAFLWAIPFAVLGLPAVLALYFGVAAMAARAIWSEGAARILALAASLAVFEYLRGHLFTGFPWNELGVLAAPVPLLSQSVALVGLHGLTLLAVAVFAAPAALAGAARGGRAFVAFALLLLAAHLGFGAWRLAERQDASVPDVALRIVQPNIDQSEKWDEAEAERIFARLLQLTQAPATPAPTAVPTAETATRRLIVWPESAFPFFLVERPDAVARLADAILPGETLVAGAARPEIVAGAEPRFFNSVYAIDDNGEILDARDKLHLVPFGEYFPMEEVLKRRIGLTQLAEMPGGFSAGVDRRPLALPGLPPLLSLICYEIIFQDEIDGLADRPGAILNVTNDAWFGDTPGPYQHLRQAELTATALGLPLIRAANTGISAVVDAYGVPRDGLALGSAGTIETALPVALPPTFFARTGNFIFWLAVAGALLFSVYAALRDARID
ncbi:apolipoprotein N-acyltransferase [Aureimonas endophytica]|uniref:Apolipoprotein N-acyltransferase n=1 Tax=Aureimonas endophytica TaxID=2027858 RepID=A0A917A1B5_9HYPH|nr:apolipoprotein N-acyltransferase [Aureimonas endophytica]GGE21920.1 apolipoprotein N-acyltransferase [Aureimonas endophytica]